MSERGFPYRLIVLRHGQSEWNAAGVFTGWENAYLTAQGELEAAHAGVLLAEHGVLPDFVHTSLLRRTIRTAELRWPPSTATGSRCAGPGGSTGAITGRSRQAQGRGDRAVWRAAGHRLAAVLRRGAAADRCRRRGARPPIRGIGPCRRRAAARRIARGRLGPAAALLVRRDRPGSARGPVRLVVSHNNTLRALVKHIESIPDEQIAGLEIATGVPLVYQLGADLRPDALGGHYLDPRAARATASPSWTDQGRPAQRRTVRAGRPEALLGRSARHPGRPSDTAAGPSAGGSPATRRPIRAAAGARGHPGPASWIPAGSGPRQGRY